MATGMMTNSPSEFFHPTREDNLTAAKRAARRTRRSRILRHSGMSADVIDIMVGNETIERHICRSAGPYIPICDRKKTAIESLALYG